MTAPSTADNPRWMHPLGWGGTLLAFGAAGVLAAFGPRFVMPPVLAFAAIWLLRQEALDGVDIWRDRLRFRRMTARDWRTTLIAVVIVAAAVAMLKRVLAPSLTVDALAAANILSQQVLWCGVVLPRQEAALADRAWMANALGWIVFSASLGVFALAALMPMFLALPWVVQRRRNSWSGVIIAMACALA